MVFIRRPMSRKISPPAKKNRRSDSLMTVVISFVAHSIKRWRGKPNDDYMQALYERKRTEVRNPWRAVEVAPGSPSCAASKQLKGKRFLCTEAPRLPLPGCSAVQCSCRYKHFSDRRVGPRRADESGVYYHMLVPQPERDQRRDRGRRSTDGLIN